MFLVVESALEIRRSDTWATRPCSANIVVKFRPTLVTGSGHPTPPHLKWTGAGATSSLPVGCCQSRPRRPKSRRESWQARETSLARSLRARIPVYPPASEFLILRLSADQCRESLGSRHLDDFRLPTRYNTNIVTCLI